MVWTFTFKLLDYILLKQKLVIFIWSLALKLLMKRLFRDDEILVNQFTVEESRQFRHLTQSMKSGKSTKKVRSVDCTMLFFTLDERPLSR